MSNISERRSWAIAFLMEHHPNAHHTLLALRDGRCWDDVHNATDYDGIADAWAEAIAPAQPELCYRMRMRAVSAKLTKKLQLRLSRGAAKDPLWACHLRRDCRDLCLNEQMLLSRSVANDPRLASFLSMSCKNISPNERTLLTRGAAKNPFHASSMRVSDKDLSPKEHMILTKSSAKDPEQAYYLRINCNNLSTDEQIMLSKSVAKNTLLARALRIECANLSTFSTEEARILDAAIEKAA